MIVSGRTSSYLLNATRLDQFNSAMISPEDLNVFFNHLNLLDDVSQIPAGEEISKVTIMALDQDESFIADFNQHFSGNLTAVSSGFGAVDVIQSGIHKAWGLKQLMERYGIAAHEVMTFGDGNNDLEMLAMTPYSYAVANASDAVKAVAKNLTASNRDNGVLQVIEAYLAQTLYP